MKTSIKALIAAALAGTALFTALPASADRGDRDRGEWHEHRGHGGHHKHWQHHHHHRHYVERERVVIHERPVYRDYYYAAPTYYAPPPARYYRRDPAIVVGVDIPPLVFPLR